MSHYSKDDTLQKSVAIVIRYVLVSVVIISVPILNGCANGAKTPAEAFAQAERYRASDNCNEALELYRQAAVGDPQFERAYEGLAACARNVGDHATARDALSKAIALNPSNCQLYDFRAEIEVTEGLIPTARADALRSFHLAAANADYRELAQTLAAAGDPADAVRAINRALRVSKQAPDFYLARAGYLSDLGRFRQAHSDYVFVQKASTDRSLRALALSEEAALFAQEHDFKRAAVTLDKAIMNDQTIVAYRLQRADFWVDQKRYSEAIASYKDIIGSSSSSESDREKAVLQLGKVYLGLGRPLDSSQLYEREAKKAVDPAFKATLLARMRAMPNSNPHRWLWF